MSALDHYSLALALLSGDATARWVLADWLDEHGEYHEADFARRTRATRDGELDIAIRQLPCPEVVHMGCRLIDHATGGQQPGALFSILGRVRCLLYRGAAARHFAAAACRLEHYTTNRRSWYDEPLALLDDAVHSLAAAVRAASPGSVEEPLAAGIAVAASARSLREMVRQQYRIKQKPKELDWQIKQTRYLLGKLADHAECTSR